MLNQAVLKSFPVGESEQGWAELGTMFQGVNADAPNLHENRL